MKTLRSVFFIALAFVLTLSASAQTKEESFKVSGNCGMCKTTIEKAAKTAGVEWAEWNKDTKVLSIRYQSNSTNAAKVQEAVAKAGYDNVGAKADQQAYDKLPACCKYDREEKTAAAAATCEKGAACCAEKKCEAGKCADGKCADGKSCASCKEKGEKGHKGEKNATMDCCKNGKCEKHS